MHFSSNRHFFIFVFFVLLTTVSAERLKWSSDLNTDVTGGILVEGDYIYVSSLDSLSKLQASDGKMLWNMQLKGSLLKPVRIGSVLVVLSHDGNVYVVSDSSRTIVKTTNLSSDVLNDPLLYSGMLYIPTSKGIVSLNPQSGTVNWVQKESCITHSTPVVLGTNLLVVCEDGLVKMISIASGTTIDQASYPDVFWKSTPAVSENAVIFGSFGGKVYALSQKTPRNFMWTQDTVDGTGVVSDIIIANNRILISTAGGNLCMLSSNGITQWCVSLDSECVSKPITTNNQIYAISDRGTLYGISYDGNLGWKYETDLPIKADIFKKGSMIYAVSKNGTVAGMSTSSCNILYPQDGMDVSGVDVIDVEVDAYADTPIRNVQVRVGDGAWTEASKQDDVYVAKVSIPVGSSVIFCRVISDDGIEQPPYNSINVLRKTSGKNMIVDAPSFVGYGSSFNVVVRDTNGSLLDRVNVAFGQLQYKNINGQITITPHTKGRFTLEVKRAGYVPFKKEIEVGDDYTIFIIVIVILIVFLSVFYIFYKRWMEE